MPGSWEFSNADREKTCTITFRNDAARVGKRVEFDPGCVKLFPFIPEIAGWRLNDNDFLRLLDAQGNSVLEFSEVESGIFEAPKPGEGILFIQNPTDLGPAPKTIPCPACGKTVMAEATNCGYCWARVDLPH